METVATDTDILEPDWGRCQNKEQKERMLVRLRGMQKYKSAAQRLRCLSQQLERGEVSVEDVKRSVEQAADVLDTVYIDHTRRLLETDDDLSEIQTESVPSEVRDWLASTFTRKVAVARRRPAEKPRFRTIVHAVQAGIFVESLPSSGAVVGSVQRHSVGGSCDYSLASVDLTRLRHDMTHAIVTNKERWRELAQHELANKERPCDKKEADPQENMPAVAVETVSDATGPEIKEEPVSEIHSHNALGQDSVNPTENKTLSWNGVNEDEEEEEEKQQTHQCLPSDEEGHLQ
ncbi:uncharacterized protein LOC124474917 [Hypomesus transpacificus]|uniref:uncharacterized protein LOC124474917 n=1 Tax=Hypomesus transpacificus TaxID=137520 RepID=UPI001F086B91|nr:uncharacterized protein LOC124474917 [Hypomesus transpacificus]